MEARKMSEVFFFFPDFDRCEVRGVGGAALGQSRSWKSKVVGLLPLMGGTSESSLDALQETQQLARPDQSLAGLISGRLRDNLHPSGGCDIL